MDNLRSYKLQNLIESGVKCPNEDGPGAKRWYQLSQRTTYWFAVSMSSGVVNRVEARETETLCRQVYGISAKLILGRRTCPN